MPSTIYIPAVALQSVINAFLITENSDEEAYKVLPGTTVVIGFLYRGSIYHVDNDSPKKLQKSGITGILKGYRTFKSEKGTSTVLVQFKAGGLAAFFKQPIHEIYNQSLSLDNFILRSELMILEEKLHEAKDNETRIKSIEAFFLERLRIKEPDLLVIHAIGLITSSNGNIRVKELTEKLFTSQSVLEKRFRSIIGTTPKKFATIVRMRHTIDSYRKGDSLTSLSHEHGFYDQPHFIKEFKTFTGETPDNFFSDKSE